MCDTPGFAMQEKPSIEICRKAKKLILPRNHSRVTQSSIDMLRSWRGNCDIQMLIYDSSPHNIDTQEISRVTDYVVGYIGKGNSTLLEEKETNKQLIMKAEEMTGDDNDLKRVSKKILNNSMTRRLMSKQETCVLLANLPLTTCSDHIETVSISNSKRLQTKKNQTRCSLLDRCANRTSRQDQSLHDFFHSERRRLGSRPAIPHFTGINGLPTFPVTESYARQTLIVHKPWTTYPNPDSWIREFDRFINSKQCSKIARMQCDRVMQRHYNGTKFVDPVASNSHHDPLLDDFEDEEAILLAGLNGDKMEGIDSSLFDNIVRGQDFKWDKLPQVGHFIFPHVSPLHLSNCIFMVSF